MKRADYTMPRRRFVLRRQRVGRPHIPSRSGATGASATGETDRPAVQRQRRTGGCFALLYCGGGDERSALGRRLDCGGLHDAGGAAGCATGGVSCPATGMMTLMRSCVSGGVGGYGDGVGEREGEMGRWRR